MRILIRVLFLVPFSAWPLVAQTPFTLTGRVLDPQGAAIAGAKVSVYTSDNVMGLITSTDESGVFRFERISFGVGSVILNIEAPGFRRISRSVAVQASASQLNEDITLEIAGLNDSVLVTAAGIPQTIDQTSKAISVIDQKEIEDRDEFSVTEILRTTPGLQIRTLGGLGQMTEIRMRGLRPEATAVLVDGMRFRDPSTTQGDSTSFLSTLSFVSTGRVEILRGSGSSLYGSNAVGGAINLMTDEGGGPTHGQIQAEGGGLGFARGRASLSGGLLGNRLTYTVGLTHINLMNGIDENDRLRNTGGQAFLGFQITPTMKVTGRFYGADDFAQTNVSPMTAGIPSANFPAIGIIPAIPLAPDQVRNLNARLPVTYGNATYIPSRDDPDNRRASRFYTSGFAFYHAPSDAASWQVNYNRVQTRRVYLSGPAGGGFQPASLSMTNPAGDIDTLNARVNLRPFSAYQLTAGYEFEREEFRDHQDNFLAPPRQVRVFGFFNQRSNAAFMQHQVSLLQSRLQLSVSGRIQSFNLSRPEFQATGITNVYEGVAAQNPRRGLTGDVSLAYMLPRTGTKVRAHAGNAYRAPSLFERYGGGYTNNPATGAVGLSPYGDPRLSPDRYNSFDFGVDQYIGRERARLSATYFYTRIQQLIIFDFSGAINPATDPFGRFIGYLQSTGGISRGVELSAESRPIPTLVLSGSYTFTNSVNSRDIQVPGFVRSLTIPQHTFTLVARKELSKRADVTFDLFYGSSYFLSFFAATGSRPFEFPGFTKADLVGGYRLWQSDNRSVRLYGKIENVFNQTYYENGCIAPGAWAIAGLTYRF